MKKVLIFVLCFVVTALAVIVSGYGNFTRDISESTAIISFIAISLLLSLMVFAIVIMYSKIKELTVRISKLEEESKGKII